MEWLRNQLCSSNLFKFLGILPMSSTWTKAERVHVWEARTSTCSVPFPPPDRSVKFYIPFEASSIAQHCVNNLSLLFESHSFFFRAWQKLFLVRHLVKHQYMTWRTRYSKEFKNESMFLLTLPGKIAWVAGKVRTLLIQLDWVRRDDMYLHSHLQPTNSSER